MTMTSPDMRAFIGRARRHPTLADAMRRHSTPPVNVAPLSSASGPTTHHPFAALADWLVYALALVWLLACEAAKVAFFVVVALLCLVGVWAILLWLVLIGWLWAWSLSLAPAMTWR